MLLWEEKEAFGGFFPKTGPLPFATPQNSHRFKRISGKILRHFPCHKHEILAQNSDGEGCGNSGEILREFWGVLMTI